jgi:hypothetical protein
MLSCIECAIYKRIPLSVSIAPIIFTKQLRIKVGHVAFQQAHHMRHSRSQPSLRTIRCPAPQTSSRLSLAPAPELASHQKALSYPDNTSRARRLLTQSRSRLLGSRKTPIGCLSGTHFFTQGLFSGLNTGDQSCKQFMTRKNQHHKHYDRARMSQDIYCPILQPPSLPCQRTGAPDQRRL